MDYYCITDNKTGEGRMIYVMVISLVEEWWQQLHPSDHMTLIRLALELHSRASCQVLSRRYLHRSYRRGPSPREKARVKKKKKKMSWSFLWLRIILLALSSFHVVIWFTSLLVLHKKIKFNAVWMSSSVEPSWMTAVSQKDTKIISQFLSD